MSYNSRLLFTVYLSKWAFSSILLTTKKSSENKMNVTWHFSYLRNCMQLQTLIVDHWLSTSPLLPPCQCVHHKTTRNSSFNAYLNAISNEREKTSSYYAFVVLRSYSPSLVLISIFTSINQALILSFLFNFSLAWIVLCISAKQLKSILAAEPWLDWPCCGWSTDPVQHSARQFAYTQYLAHI